MVLDVIIAFARFQYRGQKDKIREDQETEEDGPSDKKDQDNENEDGFWKSALLLEGLAYCRKENWKRSHQSEEEETTQF